MNNKFLFHDRIIVRFTSLFVIGAILFTLVWYLSYYFLPEGLLRGKTGATIIVGSEAAPTMLEEWGKIVMYNLIAVATYNQSRFALTEEMHSLEDLHCISPVSRLSLEQWAGIGLAIALILLAGWHEAAMIMAL